MTLDDPTLNSIPFLASDLSRSSAYFQIIVHPLMPCFTLQPDLSLHIMRVKLYEVGWCWDGGTIFPMSSCSWMGWFPEYNMSFHCYFNFEFHRYIHYDNLYQPIHFRGKKSNFVVYRIFDLVLLWFLHFYIDATFSEYSLWLYVEATCHPLQRAAHRRSLNRPLYSPPPPIRRKLPVV